MPGPLLGSSQLQFSIHHSEDKLTTSHGQAEDSTARCVCTARTLLPRGACCVWTTGDPEAGLILPDRDFCLPSRGVCKHWCHTEGQGAALKDCQIWSSVTSHHLFHLAEANLFSCALYLSIFQILIALELPHICGTLTLCYDMSMWNTHALL